MLIKLNSIFRYSAIDLKLHTSFRAKHYIIRYIPQYFKMLDQTTFIMLAAITHLCCANIAFALMRNKNALMAMTDR